MQFKLLNFHKLVGTFATTLVGTFIPLMIYKETNSIRLAALFIFGQALIRILSNHVFRKLYTRYPQSTLLLRLIPLLIYNISLIFLDQFLVIGIILITISYGVNLSLKNNSLNILLNYSSKKKSSKNLTSTRVIEYLSSTIACLSGGIFIDWNQNLLIIFSISLYIISVLPIFIYYLSHRSEIGFNKDFTSNAAIYQDQQPELKSKRIKLVKWTTLQYYLFYSLFFVINPFTNMYTLYLFIDVPTFAKAGYLNAVYNIALLIGVLTKELLAKKIEIRKLNVICAIICIAPIIAIPLIQNNLSVYLLMFVFGFTYAICSYFMMNSLLTKCKIIGCTNRALTASQDGLMTGQMLTPMIIILFGEILPVFFVMAVTLVTYAIYSYIQEEQLRKKLVNYLENNDIE